ncbi:MAG: hypothetical protein AB7P02_15445 [Alphaproteobacteria bacterium]
MSSKPIAMTLGALLATTGAIGAVGLAPSAAPAQSPGHGHAAMHRPAQTAVPKLPGQDAFGAIQEIVRILDADPATDWSRVDLAALRRHLVDMSEVTLSADAVERPVEGGLEVAVTGAGRTLDAIRRMIPAHARELNELPGWNARTEPLPDGVRLTVMSADPGQIVRIRGLGFIGLLVSGSHHQPHHLMMARGQHIH